MGNVKKKKIALGLQLLIALFLGGAAGYFLPQFASFYQFLGQAFIRLISMLIIPLVLPLVVVAVAEVLGKNHFQKLLGKTFLYFFAVTTGITALFVFASYYLGFGQGVNIGQEGASLEGIATGVKIDAVSYTHLAEAAASKETIKTAEPSRTLCFSICVRGLLGSAVLMVSLDAAASALSLKGFAPASPKGPQPKKNITAFTNITIEQTRKQIL